MGKLKLSTKIFIGLVLGIIAGLILFNFKHYYFVQKYVIDSWLYLVGNAFTRGVQMLGIPLIICSLILGASGAEDVAKLGKIGIKILAFFIFTTLSASCIGLFVALFTQPGIGVNFDSVTNTGIIVSKAKATGFVDLLLSMIPTNPFSAIGRGDMLPIITFSFLLGITLAVLGSKMATIRKLVDEANEVSLKIIEFVMMIAPIGIFCLITKTFADLGLSAIKPLLKYILTVIVALVIHVIFVYGGLLIFVAKYNPIKYLRKFFPVITLAFSTSSSSAALPAALKTTEKELKVSNTVGSFAISLGNAIHMDGSATMQVVATIFIAGIYGITITPDKYMTLIFMALLASIGTAGIPGGAIIMLSLVLSQVGVPLSGIVFILGVDRIVDMFRTTVNVIGDSVCTLCVARIENEFVIDVPELEVGKNEEEVPRETK